MVKTKKVRVCRECGNALPAGSKALFCVAVEGANAYPGQSKCKSVWNNRRKTRGAMIYDLWMARRYLRTEADQHDAWKEMCRVSEQWNDEDKAAGRIGERRTFEKPGPVIGRLKDTGNLMRARKMRI